MIKTAVAFVILIIVGVSSVYAYAEEVNNSNLISNSFDDIRKMREQDRVIVDQHTDAIHALETQVAGIQSTPAPTPTMQYAPPAPAGPPQLAPPPPAPRAIEDRPEDVPAYRNGRDGPSAMQGQYPGRTYGRGMESVQNGGYGGGYGSGYVGQQARPPCQLDFTVYSRRVGRCIPRLLR
jgi:hypothetical protein